MKHSHNDFFYSAKRSYIFFFFLNKNYYEANIEIAQRKKNYKSYYYIIFVLCSYKDFERRNVLFVYHQMLYNKKVITWE